MRLGMIGAGKMGGNMVQRLLRGGHEVVVYDLDPELTRSVGDSEGATASSSMQEMVGLHAAPFGFDLHRIASLCNHGSVVRSWLLEPRLRSRQEESYSAQGIAALRNQFGGHAVREAKPEDPIPGR